MLEALRRVGRQHRDATVIFHTAIAERLGLHPTDSKALSLLERRGRLAAGAITQATGLTTTASVTALIDRLEGRDFVRRLYTTEELEVVVDFLTRNTERLRAETRQLSEAPGPR